MKRTLSMISLVVTLAGLLLLVSAGSAPSTHAVPQDDLDAWLSLDDWEPDGPEPAPVLTRRIVEWYHMDKCDGFSYFLCNEDVKHNHTTGTHWARMGLGLWKLEDGDYSNVKNWAWTDQKNIDWVNWTNFVLGPYSETTNQDDHDLMGDLSTSYPMHYQWTHGEEVAQPLYYLLHKYDYQQNSSLSKTFWTYNDEYIIEFGDFTHFVVDYLWDDAQHGPHSMALEVWRLHWNGPPYYTSYWEQVETPKSWSSTLFAEGAIMVDCECTDDVYCVYNEQTGKYEWSFKVFLVHNTQDPTTWQSIEFKTYLLD